MVKKDDDDDDDKFMRKNTGRREDWDQWSIDYMYLDRVDGKGGTADWYNVYCTVQYWPL